MSTNDVTSVTSKISSILNAFYCKDPLKLQFPPFLGSKDRITSELKGQYAIIASFVGTEGYWGSETTTYLTLSDAPAHYPTYPGYQGPSASEVAQNIVNNFPADATPEQVAQAVVNAIPEYPEIPEQQEVQDYTNMFIILFIAVAVAIVIGLVSLYRKK